MNMTDKDLIDTANIAAMLGISRAWVVNNVTKRPDFPKPRVNLSQRLRRWSRADVSKWMQQSSKPS